MPPPPAPRGADRLSPSVRQRPSTSARGRLQSGDVRPSVRPMQHPGYESVPLRLRPVSKCGLYYYCSGGGVMFISPLMLLLLLLLLLLLFPFVVNVHALCRTQ